MTHHTRRGLSLTEVLVALLAIAVAVVPMLQSGTSIHRQSYMGEFHVLAAMRARTLLGLVSSMDFDVLHQLLGRQPQAQAQKLDLEALLPPGELSLMFSAPANVDTNYGNKLKLLSHEVAGRILDKNAIGVGVIVRWTITAEKDGKVHEHRATAVLYRPEGTASLAVKQ